MSGVNKVILIGRLGKDPETKFMPSGDCVCSFSLATSESYKDKAGQKVEKTEWHNIVAFRRLAEVIGEYCRKGSQIYIEGKLKTRKYQDKQGVEKYITEIEAREMQLLGGRGDSATGQQQGEWPAKGAGEGGSRPAAKSAQEDYEDEIPF